MQATSGRRPAIDFMAGVMLMATWPARMMAFSATHTRRFFLNASPHLEWPDEKTMKTNLQSFNRSRRGLLGSSLAETVISLGIVTLTISGSINGYVLTAKRAEWSAYSLAAHSLAMQRLEQTRAAKWDTAAYPPVDLMVQGNFVPVTNILDVPVAGSNIVYAISYTSVTNLSANPPMKMVRVDTVWPFMSQGLFTNTVISYRAPDQ